MYKRFVTRHEVLNRLLAILEDVSEHEEADSTVAIEDECIIPNVENSSSSDCEDDIQNEASSLDLQQIENSQIDGDSHTRTDEQSIKSTMAVHVVLSLVRTYVGKGRKFNVTMDNFFTSLKLAEKN